MKSKNNELKRTGLTVSELLDPDKIREIEEQAWQLGGHGRKLTINNNNNNYDEE